MRRRNSEALRRHNLQTLHSFGHTGPSHKVGTGGAIVAKLDPIARNWSRIGMARRSETRHRSPKPPRPLCRVFIILCLGGIPSNSGIVLTAKYDVQSPQSPPWDATVQQTNSKTITPPRPPTCFVWLGDFARWWIHMCTTSAVLCTTSAVLCTMNAVLCSMKAVLCTTNAVVCYER